MTQRRKQAENANLDAAPSLPFDEDHWAAICRRMGLSAQQARIVELVLRDQSVRQIALSMEISEPTVKTYLQRIGVERIHAHRQPLLRRLQQELPRLGFTSITPADSTSAIAAFTAREAERRFAPRLKKANVSVTLSGERMRVAPSFFNDNHDVERLLQALS